MRPSVGGLSPAAGSALEATVSCTQTVTTSTAEATPTALVVVRRYTSEEPYAPQPGSTALKERFGLRIERGTNESRRAAPSTHRFLSHLDEYAGGESKW